MGISGILDNGVHASATCAVRAIHFTEEDEQFVQKNNDAEMTLAAMPRHVLVEMDSPMSIP
eukprot:3658503-Karenia_brevis.AAC.1